MADWGVTIKGEQDVSLLAKLTHKSFGLTTLHTHAAHTHTHGQNAREKKDHVLIFVLERLQFLITISDSLHYSIIVQALWTHLSHDELTSQSSLMCLANVVWISVREQLSLPLEMSIKSCSEYMSSFSTKCWRSWSWRLKTQCKTYYTTESLQAIWTQQHSTLLRENALGRFLGGFLHLKSMLKTQNKLYKVLEY